MRKQTQAKENEKVSLRSCDESAFGQQEGRNTKENEKERKVGSVEERFALYLDPDTKAATTTILRSA